MADHYARLRLDRSEALAETLGVPAGSRHIAPIPLPDGPWVQVTYQSLRAQDGAQIGGSYFPGALNVVGWDTVPTISFEDGLIVDEAGTKWSDLVIEILPKMTVRIEHVAVGNEDTEGWDATATAALCFDPGHEGIVAIVPGVGGHDAVRALIDTTIYRIEH